MTADLATGGPRPDLTRSRRIHLVGVGGAGMSAIATVLAGMGHRVSGSDLKASPGLERLRALGVTVEVGHDPGHVEGAELVAISTAVGAQNPEVARARELGLPVLRRSDVLGAITAARRSVAVAGTHGKTTTSSMLALILVDAGWRPSFIIGGDVNEIGSGAAWTDGEWLVVEADESDGTFLELEAEAAVVTSVEPDHLDHYGGFAPLVDAFTRFLSAPDGVRVCFGDHETAAGVAAASGATSYGRAAGNDYRIEDLTLSRTGSRFRLVGPAPVGSDAAGGELDLELHLAVPGSHNAANGAAAAVTALRLGVPAPAVVSGLARFTGVARRYQFRGQADGVTFIDDYAHLPGEVVPVLEAAAAGGWDRVVAVFQPHRFTRTAALWRDFARSFDAADVLVVTDVYGAGEAPVPGVSGKLIVDAVLEASPHRPVAYLPGRTELVEYLRRTLRSGDLCLTLGAGDLTSLPDELMP